LERNHHQLFGDDFGGHRDERFADALEERRQRLLGGHRTSDQTLEGLLERTADCVGASYCGVDGIGECVYFAANLCDRIGSTLLVCHPLPRACCRCILDSRLLSVLVCLTVFQVLRC
jgi:hypothetical protein